MRRYPTRSTFHAQMVIKNKAIITELDMKSLSSNPCVLMRDNLIVGVYVGDVIIISEMVEISSFRMMLSTSLNCKDLGLCRYLLGLEIDQTKDAITVK